MAGRDLIAVSDRSAVKPGITCPGSSALELEQLAVTQVGQVLNVVRICCFGFVDALDHAVDDL